MPKTIVLIRHGKAEPAQEGLRDDMRTLTTAGRRSLVQSLPAALAPVAAELGEGATLAILTSPYVRARQTAKLVSAELAAAAEASGISVPSPESCDVLATDDAKAIIAEAKGRTEDVVVMVGHVPTLERASQLLCGTRLSMKPGAVACFQLVDEFNGASNLRWFAQGPLVDRWERSSRVDDEATALGKVLGSCYRSFVDTPEDPTVLDELHATIRSLRALFTFAAPLLKRKPTRSAIEDLDSLAALTLHLHEDDVLAAHIARNGGVPGDIAAKLSERRSHEVDKALAGFASRKSQHAVSNVRSLAKNLPWKTSVAENGIAPGVLNKRFRTLYEDCIAHASTLDTSDTDALFAAHRQVSQLIDVIDRLGSLLQVDGEVSSDLRSAQERLAALREARTDELVMKSLA